MRTDCPLVLDRSVGNPLLQGLRGAWIAKATAANQLTDFSRRNNNGSLFTATFSAASGPLAVEFFGAAGSYASIPHNTSVSTTGGFTVFVVFRLAAANAFNAVISKCSGNLASPYDIWVQNTGLIQWNVGAGPGATTFAQSAPGAVAVGNWYSTGFSHGGGTTPAYPYLNGVPLTPTGNIALGDAGNPIYLGKRNDNAVLLTGYVAVAYLWDKLLPAAIHRSLHVDPYLPLRTLRVTAGIIAASGSGLTTVQLDWTDVSENEDGFSIERATDAGAFGEIDTVGAGVETYDDLAVPTGHTYHYRVRATSATLGNSEYSNEAEVTV